MFGVSKIDVTGMKKVPFIPAFNRSCMMFMIDVGDLRMQRDGQKTTELYNSFNNAIDTLKMAFWKTAKDYHPEMRNMANLELGQLVEKDELIDMLLKRPAEFEKANLFEAISATEEMRKNMLEQGVTESFGEPINIETGLPLDLLVKKVSMNPSSIATYQGKLARMGASREETIEKLNNLGAGCSCRACRRGRRNHR